MKKACLISLMVLVMSSQATAWWPPSDVEIVPQHPTCSQVVTIILAGDWPDSCVPNKSTVLVTSNDIHFDAMWDYPAGTPCTTVVTAWQLSENVGPLAPGRYAVYARLVGHPFIEEQYAPLAQFVVTGQIVYVDAGAPGRNDGSSWGNAFRFLQDALVAGSVNGLATEIRVAEGTYRPDRTSAHPTGSHDRTATFQLRNGLIVEGGYAGFGKADPEARDTELYPTILSGDLSGNDIPVSDALDLVNAPSRAENCYHVVTGSGTGQTAVLDGFIITGGNANVPASADPDCGGGMYNATGSPTVANCRFVHNAAEMFGGGMYNVLNSSPALSNCIFTGNLSNSQGGGMFNMTGSSPSLAGCAFSENYAGMGGGLAGLLNGSPTLTTCTFTANTAQLNGGGMRNDDGCNPTLANCVFSGNLVTDKGGSGGAVFSANSSPTFINCTFSANNAANGSSLACDSFRGLSASNVRVTNSILWDSGNEICNKDESTITVTFSDVGVGGRWLWPGEGNIRANPLFADAASGDYHLKSQAGRWEPHAQSWVQDAVTSPCIDAGDISSSIGFEPFPNGGMVNMGAYGGTTQASKSYFGRAGCQRPYAGDVNGDCRVDFEDFTFMAVHWLASDDADNPTP